MTTYGCRIIEIAVIFLPHRALVSRPRLMERFIYIPVFSIFGLESWKNTGKVYVTGTFFPSFSPGFQFGDEFTTLTASASNAGSMPLSTDTSDTFPSSLTVNLTITLPCFPAALASAGYSRCAITHLENSFASPPLNVGLTSIDWNGTDSVFSFGAESVVTRIVYSLVGLTSMINIGILVMDLDEK